MNSDFLFHLHKNRSFVIPDSIAPYCNEKKIHQNAFYDDEKLFLELKKYIESFKHVDENEVYKQVIQGYFNKLSLKNMDETLVLIKEYLPKTKVQGIYFGEKIIYKCIQEVAFVSVYVIFLSKIWKYQIDESLSLQNIILRLSQQIFETKILEKSLETQDIQSRIDFSKEKLQGFFKFLGCLYKHDLLSENVIKVCYKKMLEYIQKHTKDIEEFESFFYFVMEIKDKNIIFKKEIKQSLESIIHIKYEKMICKCKILEILESF